MPYTPPALSPSASPSASRSSSISENDRPTNIPNPVPSSTIHLLKSNNPPRSATYLHRHRRTPSITSPSLQTTQHHEVGRQPASRGPPQEKSAKDSRGGGGSIRQSPPPADNGLTLIPVQALFSPPDSSQNSSDEEGSPKRRRGRDLGDLEEQLKEAVKIIPVRRASSPDRAIPLETRTLQESAFPEKGRRQRAVSESVYPETISDTEDDDAYRIAPPMVRKKSGELVKSSLKSPGRSRPVSMPSTPTFPKNVHFDSHIEHVRHFLHSERPSAVSAGSSPVDSHEGIDEYPFDDDDNQPRRPYEWELILSNFPKSMEARKHLPVRLEKACLSSDKKKLIGTVAVANLAFQKSVVARFTFDYWQTVSEVSAEYSNDVRRKDLEDGADRFVFKIKLDEQANLENKTLFFCIKYAITGQEFWDNNGGVNFQVDFKKQKIQGGQNVVPRATTLPRSSKPSPAAVRPRSMPTFEDFHLFDDGFFERVKELAPGSVPSRKSKPNPVEEDTALPARRANPSGNAFGNRYDFGASLNAAIKAASAAMGPDMGRTGAKVEEPQTQENPYFEVAAPPAQPPTVEKTTKIDIQTSTTPLASPSVAGAGVPEVYKPDAMFGQSASIESPSYRELLDNYCFFGSAKVAPRIEVKQPKDTLQVKKQRGPSPRQPPNNEQAPNPSLPVSPLGSVLSPPSATAAQYKASGNASPIPVNYAGLRHSRRTSDRLRFEAPHSTAIC